MRNVTELRKSLKASQLSEQERKVAENILEEIKHFGQMGAKAQEIQAVSFLFNIRIFYS